MGLQLDAIFMPMFDRLPVSAKDLYAEGLSILLNDFRAQPLKQLDCAEVLLRRDATVEDVCLILVEEECEEHENIQYHAEMSLSVDRCIDATTGKSLEEGDDAPRMRIERTTEICANFEESHRLLQQLPALYRAAVIGILVRKTLRNVKRSAMHGAKLGNVENPDEYIHLRRKALVRFYRLLNGKQDD